MTKNGNVLDIKTPGLVIGEKIILNGKINTCRYSTKRYGGHNCQVLDGARITEDDCRGCEFYQRRESLNLSSLDLGK